MLLSLRHRNPHLSDGLLSFYSVRSYGGRVYPVSNYDSSKERSVSSSGQDPVEAGQPHSSTEEAQADTTDGAAIVRNQILSASLKHVVTPS